ncbi:hypothetical protein BDN70DRAFT_717535 [Pholiota conissans]|uniref:Uncharacterized protein n=1 Tax=Pholiota conissans TaxID=109636 RepID=A0A9P6D0S4_9AGAR|nr:hypothetical protein BDN70DRAFT_717535 [Pholiota conissans]
MGSAMNSAPQPQESQQQRREFDDIEDLEMREFDDVEDIEAREPGKGGHLVHWAAKKLAKHGGNAIPQGSDSQEQDRREFDDAEELEMREYDDELEAREPGRFGRWASRKFGGRHGRHGGGGAPPSEEQQQERREFDDADDLEMREYDDAEELEMREYDDELEAREPGRFGRWASRKFGGRRHGGGGSPPPEEQQQERRET